jgi:hypothetical protein
MFFMRSTFQRTEDLRPFRRRYKLDHINYSISKAKWTFPYLLRIGGLQLDHFWIIAFKVRSIDNSLFDGPFGTELDDDPIDMIPSPAPRCLPSISHVYASSGEKEIARLSEMLVTERHGQSAVRHMCEIHNLGFVGRKDGYDHPEKSKTSNPPVRVHGQFDVCIRLLGELW